MMGNSATDTMHDDEITAIPIIAVKLGGPKTMSLRKTDPSILR